MAFWLFCALCSHHNYNDVNIILYKRYIERTPILVYVYTCTCTYIHLPTLIINFILVTSENWIIDKSQESCQRVYHESHGEFKHGIVLCLSGGIKKKLLANVPDKKLWQIIRPLLHSYVYFPITFHELHVATCTCTYMQRCKFSMMSFFPQALYGGNCP